MKKIGGNREIELQVKTTDINEIGEQVEGWRAEEILRGFLDLSSGGTRYTNFNAKIEESTHVFICDYKELGANVKAENSRILDRKTGDIYDVTLIDNPMGLDYHLEFYLKLTGGQNG